MHPVRNILTILTTLVLLTGAVSDAIAGTQVQMLNKGKSGRFVYFPEIVRVAPGDSVDFVATDKGHNAVTIDGMLPVGAERISIPFNKNASLPLNIPGVYGVKCTPHVGLGMVMLIVVGQPSDIGEIEKAAQKLPPKARTLVHELLGQI